MRETGTFLVFFTFKFGGVGEMDEINFENVRYAMLEVTREFVKRLFKQSK